MTVTTSIENQANLIFEGKECLLLLLLQTAITWQQYKTDQLFGHLRGDEQEREGWKWGSVEVCTRNGPRTSPPTMLLKYEHFSCPADSREILFCQKQITHLCMCLLAMPLTVEARSLNCWTSSKVLSISVSDVLPFHPSASCSSGASVQCLGQDCL